MKTIITATAPTVYQLKSLSGFGIKTNQHMNGSFTFVQEFINKLDAEKYLLKRAYIYSNVHDTTEDELNEMINTITNNGSLTLDAVTAHIETTD